MNKIQQIPPRTHILLARESKMSVVLRRGPSWQTAVIGWNRKDLSKKISATISLLEW